jgi:hypothetical protein
MSFSIEVQKRETMARDFHFGTVLEHGPDGYGYIVEDRGQKYVFQTSQIRDLPASPEFIDLEGQRVYFWLSPEGHVTDVSTNPPSADRK